MAEKENKSGGRRGHPPKFTDPAEMQKLIDAYFSDCKGYPLTVKGEDGEPRQVYDKYGLPIIIDAHPPTITGLALALGFKSRQALINYQVKDKGFDDTLTRAKSRVEEYAEERLFDKDGANGAKFSLANNFKGWAEKSEIDVGNKGGKAFRVATEQDAQKALEALGYVKRQ